MTESFDQLLFLLPPANNSYEHDIMDEMNNQWLSEKTQERGK